MATPIRLITYLILYLLVTGQGFAQGVVLRGKVTNEISGEPVSGANITVGGSLKGTPTDASGSFSLPVQQFPVALTISCIGFETVSVDLARPPGRLLSLIMRPQVYGLKEVEISAKGTREVFRDRDYSVLDYEIMEDYLLLLVFRYQLKRSQLVLLSLSGDTLARCSPPELKPQCLFRDFLGNVHYISDQGSAFQCYFNEDLKQFTFIHKTSFDSLSRLIRPFIFRSGNRFYFAERSADRFGLKFGFYDRSLQKTYIYSFDNESARSGLAAESSLNNLWNARMSSISSQLGKNPFDPNPGRQPLIDYSYLRKLPMSDEFDLRAERQFHFTDANLQLFKMSENNLVLINFPGGYLEWLDPDGRITRAVKIHVPGTGDKPPQTSFSGSLSTAPGWKWNGKILFDEYYRKIYAVFQRNGKVMICRVDPEDGLIKKGSEVPHAFPERIRIYKGDAYFLCKEIGAYEKWRLVKVKL